MQISVIISTFDSPCWLDLALWGYAVQTVRPLEVIVADDGSGPETRLVIERHRQRHRFPVRHVWHHHRGFRKCRILNRAIERASAGYLVFSDGDCIPRRDFLETHQRLAAPGVALSGGCVRLSAGASRTISPEDVFNGRCLGAAWLWGQGVRGVPGLLKGGVGGRWLGRVLDSITPTRATFNGHNASAWRQDVIRVNGFDERMQYGGLDRELGERLVNAGVGFRQIRHQAICLHLDHPRPYVTAESWQRNAAIRALTRGERAVWTPHGIVREADQQPTPLRVAA
jgi:glycosyltransferase involved in cell wall biosynthesis